MSSGSNVNEVSGLEYGTVKVLYELLNKKFRAAQKIVDQQVFFNKKSHFVLNDLLQKSNGPISINPVKIEFSLVTERLRKFTKGLEDSVLEEEDAAEALEKKAEYLKQGTSKDPIVLSVFRKQRANRFIIDHLLRSGYFETAQKLAEYVGADNNSRNVFHVAKQVEDALQRHDLSICLNWVLDNRSKLHRLHSNFETEVRVQQLIQLIKDGRRSECIGFLRQHFGNGPERWDNETLMHVMGLLAFGPQTKIVNYKKLVHSERWEHILEMFRRENARIFKLSNQSAFSSCLQVGLAAHKTPICKDDPDSRCLVCRDLFYLADGLPFAHAKNSRLICSISGEPLDDSNRPIMLGNGRVYGEKSLTTHTRDGLVLCPRTNEVYSIEDSLRVYVL